MRTLTGAIVTLAVASVAFTAACAANRAGGSGTALDRITHEEIGEVQGVHNLYDVVQHLRPRWLEVRAADRSFAKGTGQAGIVVFQDQAYLGDLEILRQLSPEAAYDLKWLDGPTASSTLPGLGSQHVAGAIILYTRPH